INVSDLAAERRNIARGACRSRAGTGVVPSREGHPPIGDGFYGYSTRSLAIGLDVVGSFRAGRPIRRLDRAPDTGRGRGTGRRALRSACPLPAPDGLGSFHGRSIHRGTCAPRRSGGTVSGDRRLPLAGAHPDLDWLRTRTGGPVRQGTRVWPAGTRSRASRG